MSHTGASTWFRHSTKLLLAQFSLRNLDPLEKISAFNFCDQWGYSSIICVRTVNVLNVLITKATLDHKYISDVFRGCLRQLVDAPPQISSQAEAYWYLIASRCFKCIVSKPRRVCVIHVGCAQFDGATPPRLPALCIISAALCWIRPSHPQSKQGIWWQ